MIYILTWVGPPSRNKSPPGILHVSVRESLCPIYTFICHCYWVDGLDPRYNTHNSFFFPVFYGTVFVDLAFLSMPSSQKSANKSSSQLSHQISVRSTDQAPAMSNVGVGISKQPLSNLYNKLPSADMKNFTNWFRRGSENTGLCLIFPEYDWVGLFHPPKKTANHQAQLNKTL